MEKNKMRLKGQLRMYMHWPLIMAVLLVAMNIWMSMIDKKAGFVMTLFVIVYLVIAGALYFYNRSLILADLIQFSVQYKGIENTLLKELTIPYAIVLEDGRILWKNDSFSALMEGQKQEKYISRMFQELHPGVFPKDDMEHVEMEVTYRDRSYQAVLRKVSLEGFSEKEELLHPELYIPGHYETHSDARPAAAETESVKDLVSLALETGFKGTLHICHVSAASTIAYVSSMRDRLSITMGATPHHALLSRRDAEDESLMLKMNPPLRSEEDRAAVFSALLDGTIDWAESDHAPHTIEDKEKGASGIPGIPGMLLLLSRLREAGCSDERLREAFGKAAIRAFSLGDEEISLPSDPYERYGRAAGEYCWDPYF